MLENTRLKLSQMSIKQCRNPWQLIFFVIQILPTWRMHSYQKGSIYRVFFRVFLEYFQIRVFLDQSIFRLEYFQIRVFLEYFQSIFRVFLEYFRVFQSIYRLNFESNHWYKRIDRLLIGTACLPCFGLVIMSPATTTQL